MRNLKFSIIFFVSILLLNCQSQKFYFSDRVPPVPTKSGMTSHFLFGTISSKESPIYGEELCKEQKIGMIEFQSSFLDMFLSIVTYGIYTPKHYYLYCVDNK